jgi:hypothetical protein
LAVIPEPFEFLHDDLVRLDDLLHFVIHSKCSLNLSGINCV